MLAADLHLHTNADPKDTWIRHSGRELLDHLSCHGYRVAAITCHDHNAYTPELAAYARSLGITLIPGCERTIEGRHLLLYNFSSHELRHINSFEDLRALKRERHLVIAPHPYYPFSHGMSHLLEIHAGIIDAVEHHSLYANGFDFNNQAMDKAKELNLPMVGNSDTHTLGHVWGQNYTLIDAEPRVAAIIAAIKQGRVQVQTMPLRFERFLRHAATFFVRNALVAEKLLNPHI